ncbi:MAG TPA: DEAD/DEAH box helicase [Chthoniobacterales bacterium]|nr:DEAD/DEAH box helicase [Chthoniobacterales bacterium]
MHKNSNIDHWLRNFDYTLSSSENDEPKVATQNTYHFRYQLSSSSSYQPTVKVEILFARALKSGKVRVYKPFNDSVSNLHLLDDTTKTLLMQLKGMQSFYKSGNYYYDQGKYQLAGKEGEEILLKMIETGRCYWDKNSVELHQGPEKTAEWHWQLHNDNGTQTLCYHQGNDVMHLFTIQNTWYCNEQTGEIGIMQTGVDLQILPNLLSLSKVPMEDAVKIAKVLQKHHKKLPVKAPQVAAQELESVKPIPCLRLFQTSIKEYQEGKRRLEIVSTLKPAAELSFDYKGIIMPLESKNTILHYAKKGQIFSIKRDLVKEQEYLGVLTEAGWKLTSSMPYPFNALNSSELRCLLMDKEGDPIQFSGSVVPKLQAEDWRIDIAEDYPYRIIHDTIDEWYSTLDEESSYDWFGLELGVTVKGEKINLLPVLQKVLHELQSRQLEAPSQTPQELIKKESESIFAEISDGRYIQLPADRLQSILNVFIELYDKESLTEDKKLRLSNLHAMRLLELEKALGAAQLRWVGGERLRKMGEKLSQFSGIQIVQPPPEFQGELRPYQVEGLSWLQFLREYDLSGVLADDMGLGKTVQTLSHLLLEKMSGRMQRPSLIIAPTSLMFNWQMEAERFAPQLKVLLLHGTVRKELFENMDSYDLILTTYPLIVRDKEILLKKDFYYLILDEAQCIKNAQSKAAQIATQLKAKHRLCLTGTPMENHLGELWSLFNFMMPGLLGDRHQFNRLFRNPIEKNSDYERRAHLNRRIAPFLLRRTKDKVVEELPDKVEMIRHVELSGPQRDLYETIRISMQKKVREHVKQLGLNRSHIIILDALLKLRQICCDPRLLKIPAAQKKHAESAKLELLMTSLTELLEEGRRILLFSQFTEMLGLIEKELDQKKIRYVKLTGQTKDRKTPVQQFQQGEVPLFLISLKAGGTGLNLTAADTVIHYDPWWNPAVENQATDRAHRIGQNKTVFVYKLVAKGTVEEKILEMQRNKHALMEGLFSEAETSKLKMTDKDLQSLFDPLE